MEDFQGSLTCPQQEGEGQGVLVCFNAPLYNTYEPGPAYHWLYSVSPPGPGPLILPQKHRL